MRHATVASVAQLASGERIACEPRAPLASNAGSRSDDTRDLVRAVDMLTDVVRRLDGHLDRLLEFQARIQPRMHAEPVADEAHAPEHAALDRITLERELDLVLAEIARVRIEARGASTPLGEDEQYALGDATRATLGKLRRRQGAVLARLLEFDREEDAALDLRLLQGPSHRAAEP